MAVDLQLLYPPFRDAVLAMLEELPGFRATSGHRGEVEQNKLYAQGRTTPGPIVTKARFGSSAHNFAIAVDLTFFVGGKPNWKTENYAVIGPIARKHGLVWGGDWTSFKDLPHVEFDIKALGLTLGDLRTIFAKSGMPGVFRLLDTALKG